MKKKTFIIVLLLSFINIFSKTNKVSNKISYTNEYETMITFPAGYAIGDYMEFVQVSPINWSASGYYQISISYTRAYITTAATHVASISHANPAIWRETGRVNNNPYIGSMTNFTVDCNTQQANPRFRIRAINTFGTSTQSIDVYIKITSINFNGTFTALNTKGNDLTVTKFLPMTSNWDLYVGNVCSSDGASLAIKAIQNGNVGIGTALPDEKLTVNGKIHAKEVRIDLLSPMTVPDYVFANDYKLKTLQEVEAYIKQNKHLPEIPSAKEIEKNGLMLAEMNMSLLKKIEEMTLYMIEQNKEIISQKNQLKTQDERILNLEKKLNQIVKNK